MYFHYTILRKGKEYLALLTNANTQWELGHYYDQGYAFVMNASAFNANAAIEIAKQNEGAEIVRLQAELDSLRQDYQKLIEENCHLKSNNPYNPSFSFNQMNPLDVLGFEQKPTKDELKKRYKSISQKLHPDKGGNQYLFVLVKNAYEQLEKSMA